MDNEIISNALSEIAEAAPQAEVKEEVTNEGVQEEQPIEDAQEEQSQPQEEGNEPFPKKAQNALARRDKQIAKMRAKYSSLEQEVAQLRELVNNGGKAQAKEVTPDNYETYADYLLAKADEQVQKRIEETLTKGKEPQISEQDKFIMQREQEIAPMIDDLAKKLPDFTEVMEDYADDLDELPVDIQNLLWHAENPALAVYNIIKAGKLEALGRMPAPMAAVYIVKMQAEEPVKRVSQAPAPVAPISGTPRGQKSTADMSPEEILAKYIER